MILTDWSVDIVKKLLYSVLLMMLEMYYSLSLTYFVGKWAITYACAERGYEACGGEYLLVLLCFITSFHGIRIFFKYHREEKS